MKTQFNLTIAFTFLFLAALTGWLGKAAAEEGSDKFFLGYTDYLKKDFKNAFFYWKPLAEAGNVNAQYFLGIMYLNGQGTKKNWAEASKWFQASAEQGDVGAQFLIGEMNLKGMGLAQDYQKAGSWYKKAAEKDYPDAQYRLGEWYAKGKGGEKNLILSYVWLKLASANGIQAGDVKRKQLEYWLNDQEINHANELAHQWSVRLEQSPYNGRP